MEVSKWSSNGVSTGVMTGPLVGAHFLVNKSEDNSTAQADGQRFARQVANALLQVRRVRGYTQAAMAKRMGLSLGQWKKYESGSELLRADTAMRWALDMGVSLYRLLVDTQYRFVAPSTLCHKALDTLSNHICAFNADEFEAFIKNMSAAFNLELPSEQTLAGEVDCNGPWSEWVDDYYRDVSLGLKRFRSSSGFTQELMATKLGVSMSSYQQYERDSRSPRFGVNLLASFMEVSRENPSILIAHSALGRLILQREKRIACCKMIYDKIALRMDKKDIESAFQFYLNKFI